MHMNLLNSIHLAAVAPAPPQAESIASTYSGKLFIIDLANVLTAWVGELLEAVLGPSAARLHAPVSGQITWVHLLTTLCILVLVAVAHAIIGYVLSKKRRQPHPVSETADWRPLVIHAVSKPLGLLLWIYGAYFAATPILLHLGLPGQRHPLRFLFDLAFDIGFFVVLLWLFFRLTYAIEVRVRHWTSTTEGRLDDLLAPLVVKSLRVIVPVLAIILALPLLNLPERYEDVMSKATSLLVIGVVAWLLTQAVLLLEKVILARFDLKATDNLQARKVYTQVTVLKKTLLVIIGILTLASILMIFEEVRRVGSSILASAGVVGIIIGFAAQRTISNLFAGLQIAITQPIRLDDVVIVEGEWGRVEEITLTFVIIRIWDDRRLMVPLNHFIEKPFQNWTRVSTELLGSVFLYVDYTLPLDELRTEIKAIVENSPLWDRRFWNLQVTDTTERSMQLRILLTASSSSRAWDLRCEVREKLLTYIQAKFPQSLPRVRAEVPFPPQLPPGEPARTGDGREHSAPSRIK